MQRLTVERARELLAAVFVMVLIISTIVSAIYYYFFLNYAEIEARTIEQALVEGGAVKKCSESDSGFKVPSSISPAYAAYFETNLDRNQAIELISKAAKKQGFSVRQAKPGDKGDLLMADQYLKNYYFDHFSKNSTYERLQADHIELNFSLHNDDTYLTCQASNSNIKNSKNNTSIKLEIRFPDVKK